jgi:hypothetical protein
VAGVVDDLVDEVLIEGDVALHDAQEQALVKADDIERNQP